MLARARTRARRLEVLAGRREPYTSRRALKVKAMPDGDFMCIGDSALKARKVIDGLIDILYMQLLADGRLRQISFW